MEVFRKSYKNFEKIISSAPGPSPWYLCRDNPKLSSTRGTLKWKEGGLEQPLAGKTLLSTPTDEVLAIFGFHCYVQSLEGSKFLVWYSHDRRPRTTSVTIGSIEMIILDADKLQAIKDVRSVCEDMRQTKSSLFYLNGKVSTLNIPRHLEPGIHSVEVPDEFCRLKEILMLAESTAGSKSGNDYDQMNLALYILKPVEKTVAIVPQDWFNRGSYDFGYQWITRVARDPVTRKIFGEGIRLGNFVLDETGQKFETWLYQDLFHHPER